MVGMEARHTGKAMFWEIKGENIFQQSEPYGFPQIKLCGQLSPLAIYMINPHRGDFHSRTSNIVYF